MFLIVLGFLEIWKFIQHPMQSNCVGEHSDRALKIFTHFAKFNLQPQQSEDYGVKIFDFDAPTEIRTLVLRATVTRSTIKLPSPL